MKWLLFLYPWLELWSLIQLGIETTVAVAMLWVLGALVMGIALMRWAGRNSLQRLVQASAGGALPQQLLMSDFALILSGLFLAIPGLVSDLLALLVLVGPLRRLAASALIPTGTAEPFHEGSGMAQGDIIEGEFSVQLVPEGTAQLKHSPGGKPPDTPK